MVVMFSKAVNLCDYSDERNNCSIHDQSPLFCSLDKFGRVGVVKTQFGGLVGGAFKNHVCFFLSLTYLKSSLSSISYVVCSLKK
jgi:hypothetical protein